MLHLPDCSSDDFLVAFVHIVDNLFVVSTDWCEFETRLRERVVCCEQMRLYCFRSVMTVGKALLRRNIV